MIKKFTYPIPDELFVEGVSGKVNGSFTYDGPETITVFLDQSGRVSVIEPRITPDMDPNLVKEVDPQKTPEVAYLLNHYFIDYSTWEYEYKDVEMENGDIYKEVVNPDLGDAYELIYNFEEDKWELSQIIKQQDDFAVVIAKERKGYVEKYTKQYSFSEEIEEKIGEYLNLIQEIIDNPQPIKTWKYTTSFPKRNVPKVPIEIASEFSKVADIGV